MKRTCSISGFILLTVVLMVGCSSQNSPVCPLPEINKETSTVPASTRMLWGMYTLRIDAASGDMEIIPDRNAEFTCNVVNFLQPPIAPIHLITKELVANESNIPAGYFVYDITLHHPFPGTKFCGFDVMGIVMDNFTNHEFMYDGSLTMSLPPEVLLQNPDGYTRWWNPAEFTTFDTLLGYINGKQALGDFECQHTLNGFKYFSDDTGPDDFFDPDPDMRGIFSSIEPGMNTRRYRLQFDISSGAPAFEFKYAVSANYAGPPAPPVPGDPPYPPDSFPISANMAEAYRVEYIDNGSSAFYVDDANNGGSLDFYIEVRDWQFDGSLSSVMNEIAGIVVESPILFDESVELDISEYETVASNHTVVRIPGHIDNVTPTSVNNQLVIITVRSGEPSTYEPQIPGITGYEYPEWAALAGYNIIAVPISDSPSGEVPEKIGEGRIYKDSCLQVNSHGRPEIFYSGVPEGTLGYARYDGASWEDLSVESDVKRAEGLALDSNDNPHIVYGTLGDATTNYATNEGSGWEETVVYSISWPGTDSSIILDGMDLPHLAIHGGGGGGQGVWHYWYDGDEWCSDHPVSGDQLIGPHIEIDSEDYVHILTHIMYGSSHMRHIYQTETGWVDEEIGLKGNCQDAKFDSGGNIHLAYSTGAGGDAVNALGYVMRTDAGWGEEQVLDMEGDLRYSSLVLDSSDNPHIAYVDRETNYLKYAHYDGVSWEMHTVVDDCEVDGRTSIAMLPIGVPIIAYNDYGNGEVKCVVVD